MKQRGKILKFQDFGFFISVRIHLILLCLKTGCAARDWSPEPPPAWARESPFGSAKITALDVICGKEQMTVRAEFSSPFQGIISSKGTYGQDNCVYIKPYSSVTHATFSIRYDQCGTKPDLQGKFYENTIVIQYGTDIIEAYDEAKRLRCEWFEAYEKPATFRPAIPVADLDVIEMNFQGDEIDCWMSIQEGKGPWAREVSRIVAVGQPMTIVVAINDYKNQFDMRVKSCFAHDGIKPAIHLTDEYGCVLRPKMLTAFKKVRDSKGKATLISYAQFLAFKFPDTMDVQIQCTIEVCRHGCADACQVGTYQPKNPSIQVSAEIPYSSHERKPHQSEEEHSLYQDIDNAQRIHPLSSQLTDQSTHLLDTYDIDMKNDGIDRSQSQDQAHQSADYYLAAHSHHKTSSVNKNLESYNQEMDELESDNKPVLKHPDVKSQMNSNEATVDNKQKQPINLDFNIADLKPEDLDIANKMLSNYGLNKANIDFSNLAATFAQGLQNSEITSLFQNEKFKELTSKLTNGKEAHSPVAEALALTSDTNSVSALNDNSTDSAQFETSVNEHLNIENMANAERIHLAAMRTPMQSSQSTPGEHMSSAANVEPNINHFASHVNNDHLNMRQPLHQTYNKKLSSVSKPVKSGGPVVQVVKVPLQPGFPQLQVLPNGANNGAINMFKHHNQPQQPPPHVRLHHNVHPHRQQFVDNAFPKMQPSNLEIMKSIVANMKERPTQQMANLFPHGPRSLRLKRSNKLEGEIGLRKGFQVVTSVDLAFFPNVSTDSAPIYEGRRDNILYGVCMPVAQLATGLSCILWLIVVSFTSCACMIYKLDRYKKSALSAN